MFADVFMWIMLVSVTLIVLIFRVALSQPCCQHHRVQQVFSWHRSCSSSIVKLSCVSNRIQQESLSWWRWSEMEPTDKCTRWMWFFNVDRLSPDLEGRFSSDPRGFFRKSKYKTLNCNCKYLNLICWSKSRAKAHVCWSFNQCFTLISFCSLLNLPLISPDGDLLDHV